MEVCNCTTHLFGLVDRKEIYKNGTSSIPTPSQGILCHVTSTPDSFCILRSTKELSSGIIINELPTRGFSQQQFEHRVYLCPDNIMDSSDAIQNPLDTSDLPLFEEFIDSLQKCRKSSNLVDACYVHLKLCNAGLEAHDDLGNYLIPMFAECKGMNEALRAFHRLNYHSEHSWTSLVQGYVAKGEPGKALVLYDAMLGDSVDPSDHTFVALVRASMQMGNKDTGLYFHSEIIKKGNEVSFFIASALVNMYVKFGLLDEANHAYECTNSHDIISLTALISGYVDHGLDDEALACVENMQLEGMTVDAFIIAISLKASCNVGCVERIKEMHHQSVIHGFSEDLILGNIMIDTYAKCGLLAEAERVFYTLPTRDSVSWTTLISAYMEHELGQEALNCLELLQHDRVNLVPATFVCILKACMCINSVDHGEQIHSKILEKGFETDILIVNTLVDMYAKFGLFLEARHILHKLSSKDAICWTSVMTGYLEHGYEEEVLKSYTEVMSEAASLDAGIFVCSLKACGNLLALNMGRTIHSDATKLGFEIDSFVGNTLMGMYSKCGVLFEAQEMFEYLASRDVVSWNAKIAGYVDDGSSEKALKCLDEMQSESIVPGIFTFASSLKACGNLGDANKGRQLHEEVIKKGFDQDVVIGNSLIDMYNKCGCLIEGEHVFETLNVQDEVTLNTLICGYVEHGLLEQASKSFQQMQLEGVNPDLVCWNTLILGYAEQGEMEKACMLNAVVQEQSLLPNTAAYISILKGNGDLAYLDGVKLIHAQTSNLNQSDEDQILLVTTLIDTYSKCGTMVDAQQVFDETPRKVIALWNALITGYTRQGESDAVFNLLSEMIKNHICPDDVTFLSILNVCCHAGLVNEGQDYFKMMSRMFGIVPQLEHYTCIVDLYARAGKLDEAIAMVRILPSGADLVVWHAVLSACRKWGNTSFGSDAFQNAMLVDKEQSSLYISMANIWADTTTWK